MNTLLLFIALSTAGTAALQSELDGLRERQQIPGVAAVVAVGETVHFSGASGVADIESGRVLTPDTPLYAGSLSKLFTAVMTLRLVERQMLSLDQTVEDMTVTPDISIAHLLTHASGLQREGDFGYWFSADFPDSSALREYLAKADTRSSPGADFHYSNVGYAVLGDVIESTTRRSFAAELEMSLLQPLGLQNSGAPGPVDGISRGYTPVNRIIPSTERAFAGVGARVGNRNLREYHDARAMAPAFGIYTTANDLSRLARFLLGFGGDDILSKPMRSRMLTAQPSGWGLGIKMDSLDGRPVARHSGWFAAHRSHLILDLRSRTSVVVLSNTDGGNPGVIAEALLRKSLAADAARDD